MTIAQNSAVAEIGIAAQSGEGSVNTTPAYAHPIFDGLPKPVQSINPFKVTDKAMQVPGLYKSEAHWEYDGTIPVFADSIGQWLKGLMPTDSISGAGDPYTHAFTFTGTQKFMTIHTRRPGTAAGAQGPDSGAFYEQFVDGLIEEVNFQFNSTDPLQAGIKAKGKTIVSAAGAYSATITDTMNSVGVAGKEMLIPIGATFKLDLAATPATTQITNIQSGSVRIAHPVDLVDTADSLTPVFMNRGLIDIGVSLDLVWKDYTAYRSSYFGSTSGTTLSGTIVQGSVDLLFAPLGGTASHTLEIALVNCVFLVPDEPQPNADGSALMLHLDGLVTTPSSGSIITVTQKNAVAAAF